MSRDRMIRQSFWESNHPDDPWARLLFCAMWNYADDYGVGICILKKLNGFAFPNDDITDRQVEQMLRDIAQSYGVVYYTVGKQSYYQIPTWSRHQYVQHPNKTRNPTQEQAETWLYRDSFVMPDDPHEGFMRAAGDSHDQSKLRELEIELEDKEKVISTRARATTKRGSRIPDEFMPSASVVQAIKGELGVTDSFLTAEHRKFCDYWAAKSGAGATKVDWDATWRNWIRTAVERGGGGMAKSGQSAKVAGWAELGDD